MPDLGTFGARLRRELLQPVQLLPLIIAPVLYAARQADLIADIPFWVLLVLLVTGQALSTVAQALWPRDADGWRLWVRVGVELTVIGAVIYTLGWGPTLAIGFVFGAADNIRVAGSRAANSAIAWSVALIGVGELAIAVGIAPTLVPVPLVHGLAVLALLGVAFTINLLAVTTRAKEVAEEDVREREQRFRALVQNATDVIMVSDADGRLEYVSPACERVFRVAADTLIGARSSDLVHADDTATLEDAYELALLDPGAPQRFEARLRATDGSSKWFEISLTNLLADHSVGGLVANLHDITERRQAEDQLSYQADHDALTDLPNRRYFLTQLQQAVADARAGGPQCAVLFLDLDRFKFVNDSYGHDVGDRVLIEVADRIRRCLRGRDLIARFGGDEFTVLLTELRRVTDATGTAERINEELGLPIRVGGHDLRVSSSIGIAVAREHAPEPGELLREADLAMYVAKENGRFRWELFDPESAPRIAERLALEHELWQGIGRGELQVHFQPEVALSGGDVIGLEALVRWHHPEHGLLDPGLFVPLAEETELIVKLDRYVLATACAIALDWPVPVGGPLTVGVNVSPRFLRRPGAADELLTTVRDTGFDPRSLQIEITERSTVTDDDLAQHTLEAVREHGVRVAIDDFGTGYASLAYLKKLPVDVVKLDASFVSGMETLPADAVIVEGVIRMGHALGLRITAEGVERPEQAARLAAMGCDGAQGYLYWPALTAAEVEDLLTVDRGRVVPFPGRRRQSAS